MSHRTEREHARGQTGQHSPCPNMLPRVRRFQSTEIASQAKEKGPMTRTRTTDEYNQPIIREFRENGGKVGGIFEKLNSLGPRVPLPKGWGLLASSFTETSHVPIL